MAAKNAYEYVRFEDHPIVTDDLSQSSEQLKHCIGGAFEAKELQAEKHAQIEEAKRLIAELLGRIHEFNKLMLREKFESTLEKGRAALKPVVYRETKKKIIRHKPKQEEKETLVKSEKALHNLQKNLEILKRQLG